MATLTTTFALPVRLRDYSKLFQLYNVAELSSKRTGGNRVQVETEYETFTVMCSRSPQNVEFSHFTSLLPVRQGIYQIYNARAGPLFFALNPVVF